MAAAEPATFQVPSRANFAAHSKPRGLESGDGLSEQYMEPWRLWEDGWDLQDSQAWGTELVLWSSSGGTTLGIYGGNFFVPLHHCGSHWTFISALNAKCPRGSYLLPLIIPGDFLGRGQKAGLGGHLLAG